MSLKYLQSSINLDNGLGITTMQFQQFLKKNQNFKQLKFIKKKSKNYKFQKFQKKIKKNFKNLYFFQKLTYFSIFHKFHNL